MTYVIYQQEDLNYENETEEEESDENEDQESSEEDFSSEEPENLNTFKMMLRVNDDDSEEDLPPSNTHFTVQLKQATFQLKQPTFSVSGKTEVDIFLFCKIKRKNRRNSQKLPHPLLVLHLVSRLL